MESIDIDRSFAKFTEHWRPKVIAEMNGQEVKLVKVKGEFVWHSHDAEDELFIAWKGTFRVEFRDRTVNVREGECLVVPRGVEHRTIADEEVEVIIVEPATTRNTGNVTDDRLTAPQYVKLAP